MLENNLLSKQNTNAIKGLLSICIVIHHLYGWTNILHYPIVSVIISGPLGYWSVSLFFFFSGYGIWNSVLLKSREGGYIRSFPRNRLLPFFCVNSFLILLYTACNIFLTDYEKVSFRLIAQSFLWGDTVIKNGWYLQVQMLLYVVFFVLSSLLLKKNNGVKLYFVCFTVFEFAYIVICIFLKIDVYWYQTIFLFGMGMVWAHSKEKIDAIITNHKIKATLISSAIFAIGFLLNFILNRISLKLVATLVNMVSILFFDITVILIMSLSSRSKFYTSKVLQILGRYSFGTYVLHGAWMCILRGTKVYIANDYLYITSVLILTAVSTMAFTPFYEKVFKMFKAKKFIHNEM